MEFAMTNELSPLAALCHALDRGASTARQVAADAARRANSNASRNVYLTMLSDESAERANKLEEQFPEGGRTALYGVPVSIKDCFDVKGAVTSCGSRYYAEAHGAAAKNSWVAQRLLDRGAVLTGKTHLHQLAYGITGENADYGDCLQPRDAGLLTGGSSSGAAASVQEGSAVVAIGTDTGGSVRVPAALCGIAGYRASLGVSRGEERWRGAAHLAPSFDTLGLLFRDLRDGPALANAIFDVDIAAAPSHPRVGFVDDSFLYDCEPDVVAAYAAWKERLVAKGASCVAVATEFWSESLEIFAAIQASEAAAIHKGHYQHFETAIGERLEWGASITDGELASYRERLRGFRSRMAGLFGEVEFLIVPCAPISRLRAGEDQSAARKLILRYTTPASLTGVPVVTLPGEHIGAPFGTGVQLMGAPMQDGSLLAMAAALVAC
jgi:Asp-tRNA(Asn)/Glu-tRNA(Gln) amidotransferase A subunit family amidase